MQLGRSEEYGFPRGTQVARDVGAAICAARDSQSDGNGIMKHLSAQQLIAYQDGESAGRDAAASHIGSCAECRAELHRLAEMVAAYQALPVPDPGEDYG